MRHDRRCFGRLEQEDQRLKKHYGRWMDIVRSLELESFILTKLTKHSIPVNLVSPQVSLPPRWVPASRGRRGSGSSRAEEYEGSLVWLQCEAVVAAGPGQRWE